MRGRAVFVALCGILSIPASGLAQRWGVRLDGTPVQQLASSGTPAVVLFFVASDCPVSNRTFPEMRRLREEFGAQGVRTWFVYPNSGEHASEVRAHQDAFDPGGEAILDPDGALVRMSHAVATPEAVVLVPDPAGWRPVYSGRVDNRFVRIGLERPAATEHFGEQAIRAALAGKPPIPSTGPPVGCAIVRPEKP